MTDFFFQNIDVKVKDIENSDVLLSFSTNYPAHLDNPRVIDALCKENKKGDFVCRFLLSTENAAIIQVQSGEQFFHEFNGEMFKLTNSSNFNSK